MRAFLNLSVRGLTIFGKFLLILFIGKYLDTETLGEFGLFISTITISIYFLGFDFYTFSTRELNAIDESRRAILIKDQFILHFLLYILFIPLISIVFFLGYVDFIYFILFFIILICEHISLEFFRLFIALKKQSFANFILFVSSGFWIYILLVLWYFELQELRDLETIFTYWSVSSICAVLLGFAILQFYSKYKIMTLFPVDYKWIRRGLKTGSIFLMGTLAYKLIELSDRYFIAHFLDLGQVGIYVFFSNISNLVNVVVFTLVTMYYYPLLIEFYEKSERKRFQKTFRLFKNKTLLATFIASGIILLGIHPLLEIINKIEFSSKINILVLLLLTKVTFNISLIFHYILYVAKRDLFIRNITLCAALVNILLNIILIPRYNLIGAAFATLITFLIILIAKFIYSKEEPILQYD